MFPPCCLGPCLMLLAGLCVEVGWGMPGFSKPGHPYLGLGLYWYGWGHGYGGAWASLGLGLSSSSGHISWVSSFS